MFWHHCHPGSIVVLLRLTHALQNFDQHIRPFAGTVHSGTVLYPSVVIDEYGGVTLRDNLSGILMLPLCSWSPARTRSRIEVFLKNVSFMMVRSSYINDEAMVTLPTLLSTIVLLLVQCVPQCECAGRPTAIPPTPSLCSISRLGT